MSNLFSKWLKRSSRIHRSTLEWSACLTRFFLDFKVKMSSYTASVVPYREDVLIRWIAFTSGLFILIKIVRNCFLGRDWHSGHIVVVSWSFVFNLPGLSCLDKIKNVVLFFLLSFLLAFGVNVFYGRHDTLLIWCDEPSIIPVERKIERHTLSLIIRVFRHRHIPLLIVFSILSWKEQRDGNFISEDLFLFRWWNPCHFLTDSIARLGCIIS